MASLVVEFQLTATFLVTPAQGLTNMWKFIIRVSQSKHLKQPKNHCLLGWYLQGPHQRSRHPAQPQRQRQQRQQQQLPPQQPQLLLQLRGKFFHIFWNTSYSLSLQSNPCQWIHCFTFLLCNLNSNLFWQSPYCLVRTVSKMLQVYCQLHILKAFQ